MQLPIIISSVAITLIGFVKADDAHQHQPTPTFESPPPPGETYVTGYPLCGIPGFTEVPGNYTEVIHQASNDTLTCCFEQCKAAYPSCKSIAFSPGYEECLFFNQVVQETQLYRDNSSNFVHYDLKCHVRG